MPATKAKSSQKRTRRPKECPNCKKMLKYIIEASVKIAQADNREAERDVMLDVMAKALEHANCWVESANGVMPPLQEIGKALGLRLGASIHDKILPAILRLQWEQRDLVHDLQLVQAGCTRELGGSVWIRGEQLAECLNRYTNGRWAK